MARKSKLSEDQWAEIERRMLAGESARSIAKDFKISEAGIRAHSCARVETIKVVADQLATAQTSLKKLPITAQIAANNLAQELFTMRQNLARGASLSAATAHRLHAIANAQVQKIDDADPVSGLAVLSTVAAFTKVANLAGETALRLVSDNRDSMKRQEEQEANVVDVTAVPTDQKEAARLYMDMMTR